MQQQQQQQDVPDSAGRPDGLTPLSRVYFNDLMYLRFSGAEATSGVWVHQPKRAGELWPSARSGHAAAAGDAWSALFCCVHAFHGAAAVGGRMFIFGGWFESSSSRRMFFLQDFYFLEPSSVIWSVPRVYPPQYPPIPVTPFKKIVTL